jgi:hypothetical protein
LSSKEDRHCDGRRLPVANGQVRTVGVLPKVYPVAVVRQMLTSRQERLARHRRLIYGDRDHGLTISRIDIAEGNDDAVEFVIFDAFASERFRVDVFDAARIAADLMKLTQP